MTENEQLKKRIDEIETALKLILDESAAECHGFETLVVKTARVALGISEEEFWGDLEGSE